MAYRARRVLFAVAVFSAAPLLVACPKKETPVVVDAEPPPPPPVEDSGPLVIEPLEPEDAGVDADAEPPKKLTGTPVNTNVARLKQCCNQLAAEAKRLGPSPEAGMFQQAAAQCSAMATAAGPSGNAPELGALKTLLAGRTIPPVCAGF